MKEQRICHRVSELQAGGRLDQVLADSIPALTRSQVRRLIDQEMVVVNGKHVKAGHKLKAGDAVLVLIQLNAADTTAEDIPVQIVYQDTYLAVIDKPAGMVVHPAAGNRQGTLVNALLFHLEGLSGVGGVERPGIVHRLDKDTSGLLVIAKTDSAHLKLSAQLASRTVKREYVALVSGSPMPSSGVIDAPIARHPVNRKKMAVRPGGRPARTEYCVDEVFRGFSQIVLRLQTGRTHQIRVHMAHIGHPLLGDRTYGGSTLFGADRQMLHARELSFQHPGTGELVEFRSPLPADFVEVLHKLKSSS